MIRISDASLVFLAISLGFATSVSAQSKSTGESSLSPTTGSQNSKATNSATTLPADAERETSKREADKRDPEKRDADKQADKRVEKIARDNAQRQYKAGLKYGRANLFRQAYNLSNRQSRMTPNSQMPTTVWDTPTLILVATMRLLPLSKK